MSRKPSFTFVVVLALLAASLMVGSAAPARADAPAPAVFAQAQFPITASAGDYALLGVVLDFAPGTGFPEHFHDGPVLATVLEGEMTLRDQGSERTVKAGESFTEQAGVVHSILNAGNVKASVWVNALVPKGKELQTLQGTAQYPPPEPAVVYQGQYPLSVKAGEYDLVNLVLDFAPGAGVPNHVHGGNLLVTVLNGDLTLMQKGTQNAVKQGESFTEAPGAVHQVTNAGGGNTRVAVSALLPKGAELQTLVGPQTLPETGASLDLTSRFSPTAAAGLFGGLLLILAGLYVRRNARRV